MTSVMHIGKETANPTNQDRAIMQRHPGRVNVAMNIIHTIEGIRVCLILIILLSSHKTSCITWLKVHGFMLITALWQQLKDCQNIYLSAVKKDNLMFFNVAHSSFSHLYLKKILQSLNTAPKDSDWNHF